ncbi:hypothetical protein OG738_11615 [Amycolatopsis sp. NBC_01488]|uniref:hypothetical protein n=1 Tax=Amycolatopsis sp. NBC_01488 TaxID=2903563 RepID=UPI002E2AF520|nr:hypothetical protein [Amycolatopsis sp. NBC_01488]
MKTGIGEVGLVDTRVGLAELVVGVQPVLVGGVLLPGISRCRLLPDCGLPPVKRPIVRSGLVRTAVLFLPAGPRLTQVRGRIGSRSLSGGCLLA